MSKKKHPILFVSAIVIMIVALLVLILFEKIILSIYLILFGGILLFFWGIGAIETEEEQKEKGISPIFESNCTHINGLTSYTAEGKIRIYVDRIHFTVAGTHYELPIERIINMGISTTSHTEYDLKAHPMRGVIGGLLLGEFGLLWGAEHELVKTETKEYFLVIAYSKDEATKFITLGNVDCKKIISTVSKYVDFQEQNVQL